MILAFDEFQHARTIDPLGGELDKGFTRTIWEILDAGKFTAIFVLFSVRLSQVITILSSLLTKGVKVERVR